MRIVFICSSFQPGMDGVGDYTRILALQLAALGHIVSIIAFNDRFIGCQDIQKRDLPIPVFRFGSAVCLKKRLEITCKLHHEFFPDWISLQFVSFGFHRKGIPFRLPSRLSRLGVGSKWHLMFHELWNGGNRNAKLSHRLLGVFEKRIVFGLLRKLKPRLCTTSNDLYSQWLNNAKIANKTIPLFSNIRCPLIMHCSQIVAENTVAIFGQLESEDLGRELISAALKMAEGRPLKWMVLGLSGPKWEKVLQEKGISFHSSGKLGDEALSFALRSCRFGLASTNIYRIGKSGSALAMLEHGLPLLVGRSGWVPRFNTSHLELPDGCLECWSNPTWENLPKNNQFKKPPSHYEIAQRFVSLLNES